MVVIKDLTRFKEALEGVVYDFEQEGGEFFLEFDGYSLKLYSEDWTYLDIDETEMDFGDLKFFRKKVKGEYLKELLNELNYQIDSKINGEIEIEVGDKIVKLFLLDYSKPSAYGLNIVYSYYIK